MSHEGCVIGSKPGTLGAYCFDHDVSVTRDALNNWKTNTHPGGAR